VNPSKQSLYQIFKKYVEKKHVNNLATNLVDLKGPLVCLTINKSRPGYNLYSNISFGLAG
jgi:hypothetical protein